MVIFHTYVSLPEGGIGVIFRVHYKEERGHNMAQFRPGTPFLICSPKEAQCESAMSAYIPSGKLT